jgi:hypothetical protein
MPSKDEIVAFSSRIERLSNTHNQNHMSVFDAVLHHCEKTGCAFEMANKLLTDTLKRRLLEEVVALKLLPAELLIPKKRKKKKKKVVKKK